MTTQKKNTMMPGMAYPATARSQRLSGWIFFLFVFSRQRFGQRMDGAFEFRQVVVDGDPQNRVISVEVAVRKVIAHACDLAPGDARLGAEHLGRQGLNSFADLQQPDADSIEYQTVGQIAS
jgi:hypothetical protein